MENISGQSLASPLSCSFSVHVFDARFRREFMRTTHALSTAFITNRPPVTDVHSGPPCWITGGVICSGCAADTAADTVAAWVAESASFGASPDVAKRTRPQPHPPPLAGMLPPGPAAIGVGLSLVASGNGPAIDLEPSSAMWMAMMDCRFRRFYATNWPYLFSDGRRSELSLGRQCIISYDQTLLTMRQLKKYN